MRHPIRYAVAFSLGTGLWVAAARAQGQTALDRPVGPDFFGKPLVIGRLTASDIGALGGAARVPMGFEAAVSGEPRPLNIAASGRPLRAVLDAIVEADARYEWRDEAGVIVLRPAVAWTDRDNVLHRGVGRIRFDDVGTADALAITVALFGQMLHATQRDDLGDQTRFNLDLPSGTVLEALNGIVRAHGALAWGIEPYPPGPMAPGSVGSPFMASLVNARAGRALGIGVRLDREPQVPEQLERWGRPQPAPAGPVLERVVGARRNGEPMVLRSAYDVAELASAAGVAMGVELLPPGERRPAPDGVTVTGLTLRDALTTLMALDPRYEWHDFEGVVVVRPLFAWTQPDHPLSRETGSVRLDAVTVDDAVNFQHALLEPGMKYTPQRDLGLAVPRISVTLTGGTHLALLNAIVRSHAGLYWMYEDLDRRETEFFGGRPHQITIGLPGGTGHGFAFK